jgi:hypothetical protein
MNNSRHSGIFTIAPTASATIIGCGGLGGTTALTLAKMGYKYLTLVDPDVVADENTGTQLFRPSDIGMPKIMALQETLVDFADDIYISGVQGRIDAKSYIPGGIIISCVDSITARKEIWQSVKTSAAEWYLEMRMAAEELQIHTVNMFHDWYWYEQYIAGQNEDDVVELPCTMKATYFTAMVAGGLAGSIVRKIHTGKPVAHKLTFNMLASVYMEF